jgi:general secretion pathway protein C
LLAHAAIMVAGARLTSTARLTFPATPWLAAPPPRQRTVPEAPPGRNIFCSTCPPDEARSQRIAPSLVLSRSALPFRLLATMVADSPANSRWSVAVIRDTETGSAGAYAVGARLRDLAQVTGIAADGVYLRHDGRHEFLALEPRVSEAPTSPPAARSAHGALERGIRKTGPTRYEVQRQSLDQLLGNVTDLARSVRVSPEQGGLRLSSVVAGGLFATLGLQSGDLVAAVNGLDLSTPDHALRAYTLLRSASHLTVNLERGGRRMTVEYRIQP